MRNYAQPEIGFFDLTCALLLVAHTSYSTYQFYQDFRGRQQDNNLGTLRQVERDIRENATHLMQQGRLALAEIPRIPKHLGGLFLLTYDSFRNGASRVERIITTPSIQHTLTLVTWLHCMHSFVTKLYLHAEPEIVGRSSTILDYYRKLPIFIGSSLYALLAINELSRDAIERVSSGLIQVCCYGFASVRKQVTFSNFLAAAGAAWITLSVFSNPDFLSTASIQDSTMKSPTSELLLLTAPFELKSPLIFSSFIISMTYLSIKGISESSIEKATKLTNYTRSSCHRIWQTLTGQQSSEEREDSVDDSALDVVHERSASPS